MSDNIAQTYKEQKTFRSPLLPPPPLSRANNEKSTLCSSQWEEDKIKFGINKIVFISYVFKAI